MSERKSMKTLSGLQGWEGVDAALQAIGEAERGIAAINVEMNKEIDAIKAEYQTMAKQHHNTIKMLEIDLQNFVAAHPAELDGRSRTLNFGKVGFRKSTRLSLPKNQADVIERIKARGLLSCLNVSIAVDKEELKKQPEDTILAVGATLKTTDDFWYETAKESVKDAQP